MSTKMGFFCFPDIKTGKSYLPDSEMEEFFWKNGRVNGKQGFVPWYLRK